MYKLKVVAGPNRGTNFALQDGDNSIGRQSGNMIVLASSKVSKQHCVLSLSGEDLLVKDLGSSNGTFVNGVLAKLKKLKLGDRISVGEYVLEVAKPVARNQDVPSMGGIGAAVHLPGGQIGSTAASAGILPGMSGGATDTSSQAPKDLKGKALWYFERFVMPVFYNLNMQREWRLIGFTMFAAFMLGNLVISVYPLIQAGRATVVKETIRRAQFMARQIVEQNTAAIAARAETKTEIGSIEREEGVRVAVLTDLENRILAPSTKLNQYFTSGAEAAFALRARDLFRKGRETGIASEIDSSTVVAVEPVKILVPQLGKNVVSGMAIVSLDTSLSTPSLGEMGMAYSETLILTGLLGGLVILIFYRLTLKPFQVLNDDIDKVLKGDMGHVTREFKFEEMDPLWDVVDSALQRVPKGGGGGGLGSGLGSSGPSVEDFLPSFRMLGDVAKFGIVVFDADKNISYLNSMFEEISGIRSDNAIGQNAGTVARDQAFGAFISDLLGKTSSGASSSDDFEFSGVSYRMYSAGLGAMGEAPRCFVMAVVKNDA